MNLVCIVKHKWEYKTETCEGLFAENGIVYPPKVIVSNTMFGTGYYSGPCDSNGNPIPIQYDRDVRMCERCKKKERMDKNFDHRGPNPKWVTTWVDCELTLADIRNDKLEQIGI